MSTHVKTLGIPGIQGIRILSFFLLQKLGKISVLSAGASAAARTQDTVSAPCIFKYAPKSDVSMPGVVKLLERV